MQAPSTGQEGKNDAHHHERQARRHEVAGLIANWMTHELDTVLTDTLIQSLLALIKLPAHEPAHAHLVNVNKGVERATALTQQLLFYTDSSPRRMEALNLNDLCLDCRKLWQAWAPAQLNLHLDLSPDTALVWGDCHRLRQVLMNFLVNATETVMAAGVCGQGRNTIEIITQPLVLGKDELPLFAGHDHLPPGEYACLAVRDHGPGMERETLAHLFEPTFNPRIPPHKCGLSLCLQIIREHRGGLHVQSRPRQGSTFRFCLPAHPLTKATTGRQHRHRRPQALVVDADPGALHAVAELLASIDVEAQTVTTGREALSVFEEERDQIGLVLLDIDLPPGGTELYRQLHELAPNIPVILASANGDRLPPSGQITFLPKPYDTDTLLRQVQTALALDGPAPEPNPTKEAYEVRDTHTAATETEKPPYL